jgi:hypothetical protein
MAGIRTSGWLAGLTGAVLVAGLAGATPAAAVSGGAPVTDGSYDFVAKVNVGTPGEGTACTGALVDPSWVMTASSCFAAGGRPVLAGPPPEATTVTVGRPDLTTSAGHVLPVVHVVPFPGRDVVLAKLAAPATGVTPVAIGTAAAATGDTVRVAGFGRTQNEWVPDRLHTAAFTVGAVGTSTLEITADQASPCKGDAGGPALRQSGGVSQLVALNSLSWQGGCIGVTETRRGAVESRVDDLAGWVRQTVAGTAVYGILGTRLTWSAIDPDTGARLTTVTSAQDLGFTPKAIAALDAGTVLVTSTTGVLYRVDVTAANPALTFSTPVQIGTGWTHDLLTYDGDGSLFGIADGTLRRYTVTTAKPGAANIINNTSFGNGFGLDNLAATGPDWIIGTTGAGVLRSYHLVGSTWTGYSLATANWKYKHLVSPGGGLYHATDAAGSMRRFRDAAPFDGKGNDITTLATTAGGGWNQTALSAVPKVSYPQSRVDVSVYGVLPGGKLTRSEIDSATGDRRSTVTSTSSLGFEPKAVAALNGDTVLVTSTAGRLYRVDVIASLPLTFATPVEIGTGWTHDLLAYDGDNFLYGIAAGNLRRYTVSGRKPVAASITGNTLIGPGFTLQTLTTAGPDWILGTTSTGTLLSYRITGAGDYDRHVLADKGWGITHLLSPGRGIYYSHTGVEKALKRYLDAAPFDGKGTDIKAFADDPVGLDIDLDTDGWGKMLLSVVPFGS